MNKKVHCHKCGRITETYNRFSFNWAQKEFKFDNDQNIDRFCLCHKCSRLLSSWLEASKGVMSYRFE
ncbi:hypothetical protein [Nitrososphaeria virus YSH_922147]|uniref:Uncharacterized protein n=1 Tax=Nitrososphaeria virus YSH_922147 TaxID=3071323 RepID=A0A976UAT0_9CAUD|nr:hypothetical protein QKV94_gp52 [Yangshan Harbor Nitrososphaeria virus]UVF62461.1 hypothetical protein [Nitrososphaeria virus YSH_922147]